MLFLPSVTWPLDRRDYSKLPSGELLILVRVVVALRRLLLQLPFGSHDTGLGESFFLSQVRKISASYEHFLIPTFLNYDCSKEFLTARKIAISRSDSESEQVQVISTYSTG